MLVGLAEDSETKYKHLRLLSGEWVLRKIKMQLPIFLIVYSSKKLILGFFTQR